MRLLSFTTPNPHYCSFFDPPIFNHYHHHRLLSVPRMAIPPKLAGSLSAYSTAARGCEEGLASKLWIKSWRESIFAKYTPFVICLASGNLKIESFRSYISQVAHFLKSFAHAYELAEECVDDDDEDDDVKAAISKLRTGVLDEIKLHHSFVQECGVDPAIKITANSATTKYTDFLVATASGKVEGVKGPGSLATPFERTKLAAYTMGAMTPCSRLYAFLGKELRALSDLWDKTHPYQKWIDCYSCESYEATVQQTEDLLDKLSVSLTGEELDIIEKLYRQAMKLEIEFFLAQPLAQPTVLPLTKEHNPAKDHLVIFSDFDLTCSVVDSSAILAEIAIVTAPKSDQFQSEDRIARMSSTELRKTWDLLSGRYTEDYEQCIDKIMHSEKIEFSYQALSKALEQLSDFERIANSRVIESGVLKGLKVEDIKRAGEHLILQDGCISFFQKLVKNENLNATIHVLSYCWCADIIRSAFSSGGLDLDIHANELMFNESISTGEIVKKMESPLDKVQVFNDILKKFGNGRKKLTVYIGDSVGDLLCLLQADIGIVIGSSSSLRRVGSHYGVTFVPLFPGLVKKQSNYTEGSSPCWNSQSGTLYTVSNWAEVHAFILGW